MVNGHDKNLVRIATASAAYREQHGEWPSEARLAPGVLWDIARVLDSENFASLAARLKLRTSENALISVGGSHGYVRAEDLRKQPASQLFELAWTWLGVSVLDEPFFGE